MSTTTRWAAFVAAVILVATSLWAAERATPVPAAAKPAAQAKVGAPTPDFTLKDVYGKTFKPSEFKGKIVVLE